MANSGLDICWAAVPSGQGAQARTVRLIQARPGCSHKGPPGSRLTGVVGTDLAAMHLGSRKNNRIAWAVIPLAGRMPDHRYGESV